MGMSYIEVQKADDDDHQRRVRYNSSLLTANIADPVAKFRDIPDVNSVFISKFDVFKRGKAVYHVERIIKETGDKVYNGTQEIYINAEINDDSDIARLMKVFVEDAYYDDKFPAISERKRIFKTTEKGVNEMCEVIERNRAEARAEGRYEIVADMLRDGMNIDTVARIAKMTAEQVMAIGKKAAVL